MSFIVSNTYDIHATASLDLQFANKKSLVDQISGRNLVDHTRASSGTYVGSDGLIKTATTNLIKYSEAINQASSWSYVGLQAFGSGSVSDAIIAPDGSLSGDKITEDSSTGGHGVSPATGVTFTSGTQYTISCFLKKGERDVAVITAHPTPFPGAVGGRTCYVNLLTGEFFLGSSYDSGGAIDTGDGWYRVWATITADATAAGEFSLGIAEDVNVFSYTGDGTSGIYLWGAQLEQSTTVGEYVKTTSTINSAPRFDHDPETGESLGLLVEESRTNLLLWSEEFDDAAWVKSNTTITPNAAVAPNGTLTAEQLQATTAATARTYQDVAVTAGVTYTASIYAKAGTATSIFFREDAEDTLGVVVDLSTGSITSGAGSIENAGNGWYRISFSGSVVGSTFRPEIRTSVTSYFYIWGAQLEEGSFPTSYIKTEGSTVTRAADVASISGSNFSSWYRQDEGTMFAETQLPAGAAVNTSSRTAIDISDGSTNNRLSARAIGVVSTADQFTVRSAGTTTAQFSSGGSAVSTATRKIAFAAKADDFASFATGATSATTDTSGAMPVGNNQANIASAVNGAEYLSGTLSRLTYWPARLPNETLQTITQ